MRRLIRILADMVEAALDAHNVMRYASGHDEATGGVTPRIRPLSDLQDEVLPADDVAAVLQSGVQGEEFQAAPQEGSR